MNTSESNDAFGTNLISAIVSNICFNHYISTIRNKNYHKSSKYDVDETLFFNIIYVTERTKNFLCTFLQLCSERYRRLSFVDKQRVQRLFIRYTLQEPNLKQAFEKNKFSKFSFTSLNEIETYLMTQVCDIKYLQVLSTLFDINIILLSPQNTEHPIKFIGNKLTNNECLCIINNGNNVYLPVIINDNYVITTDFNNIFDNMINLIQKIGSQESYLKDTENLDINIPYIRKIQNINPVYEDLWDADEDFFINNRIGQVITHLTQENNTLFDELEQKQREYEIKFNEMDSHERKLKLREQELLTKEAEYEQKNQKLLADINKIKQSSRK